MTTQETTERPNLTRTIMRMKALRNEMEEICKSFKLAMTGDDYLMEKAIRQSLDLYALTGCQDIVFLGLKLACHARKPDLVLTIFDAIFEASGDFGLLFFDVVFGLHVISFEEIEEYQWYLKVASNKVYVCENQNVNMVDVPYQGFTFAAHAASLARSRLLLMLLRNGADPYKATLLLQPSLKSVKADWHTVLRLILRALPCPSASLLKIEPGLVLVPRLKHLCKVVVRNVLASSHSLPDGIYDLEVPFELKEYLDLLRDT